MPRQGYRVSLARISRIDSNQYKSIIWIVHEFDSLPIYGNKIKQSTCPRYHTSRLTSMSGPIGPDQRIKTIMNLTTMDLDPHVAWPSALPHLTSDQDRLSPAWPRAPSSHLPRTSSPHKPRVSSGLRRSIVPYGNLRRALPKYSVCYGQSQRKILSSLLTLRWSLASSFTISLSATVPQQIAVQQYLACSILNL